MKQVNYKNVGLLVDTSIDENPWNEMGYKGLQQIEEEFNIQVYYKENANTTEEINSAVKEFVDDGVNLIIGHSNIYGSHFIELSELYPDVHFVYFNGGNYRDNVTSLNFNSNAMGFFGGMIAGEMTATNQVGVIAAYSWQPEIEGFFEGVKFQNPAVDVHYEFINDWNDNEAAMELYEEMEQGEVDVFYPVGDTFSDRIIKQAEEDGHYAIGYITDRLDFAEDAILTSTIQNVDKLYEVIAKQFNKDKLKGEVMSFDFQDEFITLGEFNDIVPKTFQKEMEDHVDYYIKTGLLPNEH